MHVKIYKQIMYFMYYFVKKLILYFVLYIVLHILLYFKSFECVKYVHILCILEVLYI